MTAAPTAAAARPRRRRRIAALLLLLAVLGLAGWVGPRALSAKRHLESARASLTAARAALQSRDLATARTAIASAGTDTSAARHLTDDPAWWLLGHIPLAGRSFAVVTGLSAGADDIARGVLPGVLAAVTDLDPHQLRHPDGSVDLPLLHRVRPALDVAAGAAGRADARVRALPDSLLPSPVAAAREKLLSQADELAGALRGAAEAVGVAPALLGEDRPRTYFVMVQQTSETRGTGGLVGGYALLRADKGRLRGASEGSNIALGAGPVVPPPPGVPQDYVDRYAARGGYNDWRNINLSPDLPTVARVVQARWRATHGGELDGVVAVDAIGLADLLRGGPPFDFGGGGAPVPVDQLPSYLGAGQYQGAQAQDQRKESLSKVAQAALGRLTGGGGDAFTELRGLADAVSSGHARMASQDPALQPALSRSGVDGALPAGPGPVAYPVLFNTTGGKLDYYLSRSVDYRSESCGGGRRVTTVTTRITSSAPASGLPPYVTIRVGDGSIGQSYTDQVDLSVYTTRGSRLLGATLDGRKLSPVFGQSDPVLQTGTEAGLPIRELLLDIAPGQTRTVVLHLDEPASAGPARVPEQPLATPLQRSVHLDTCT